MFKKAMDAMSQETLVTASDFLKDAIGMREYSAYAALIILTLPFLRSLHVADYKSPTIPRPAPLRVFQQTESGVGRPIEGFYGAE